MQLFLKIKTDQQMRATLCMQHAPTEPHAFWNYLGPLQYRQVL